MNEINLSFIAAAPLLPTWLTLITFQFIGVILVAFLERKK